MGILATPLIAWHYSQTSLIKSLGRVGNPAASEMVRDYLKAFTSEQLQAAVTPRQAIPLFPAKLAKLMDHLKRSMSEPAIPPGKLFILARDYAIFPTLFFSADRANDLSLVKTQEILRLPRNQGSR